MVAAENMEVDAYVMAGPAIGVSFGEIEGGCDAIMEGAGINPLSSVHVSVVSSSKIDVAAASLSESVEILRESESLCKVAVDKLDRKEKNGCHSH